MCRWGYRHPGFRPLRLQLAYIYCTGTTVSIFHIPYVLHRIDPQQPIFFLLSPRKLTQHTHATMPTTTQTTSLLSNGCPFLTRSLTSNIYPYPVSAPSKSRIGTMPSFSNVPPVQATLSRKNSRVNLFARFSSWEAKAMRDVFGQASAASDRIGTLIEISV